MRSSRSLGGCLASNERQTTRWIADVGVLPTPQSFPGALVFLRCRVLGPTPELKNANDSRI